MISRLLTCVVIYIPVVLVCCVAMAAEPGTPASIPTSESATTQPAPKFTLDLNLQLADPVDWDAKFEDERQALQATVDVARKPADKAAAHLAMANWLLATPTAMPATRWLTGIETPADRRTLARTAKEAQEHLLQARQLLDAVRDKLGQVGPKDDQAKEHKETIKRLETTLEKLEPFAELLATAGHDGHQENRRSAWSRAARGMASLREAADDELAACALLWQAFAWELAGRHDRAHISLPMALEAPKQPCYDFMSRLLRCRILTDAGWHAAATALAIRIRFECPVWFPREEPAAIEARQRLVGLMQCKDGQLWMAKLRASQKNANADRLEAMLAKVQQTLFADPDARPEVYHLERTIPIIANPPEIEPDTKPSEPSTLQTQPATTSTASNP